MQQKMMKYMTMVMGLLFYKVASGLCLYFIASSMWGIAERKFLPKAKPGDSPGGALAAASPKPSPSYNGSGGSKKSGKAKRKK